MPSDWLYEEDEVEIPEDNTTNNNATEAIQTTAAVVPEAEPETRNVTLSLRLVIENWLATDGVLVPAADCRSMQETFARAKNLFPVARSPTLYDQPFYAPVFLLQETRESSRALRQLRFQRIHFADLMGFRRWYNRCVEDGTEDTLKVEIQLKTHLGSMEDYYDLQQYGHNAMYDREFRRLTVESANSPVAAQVEMVVHPVELGGVGTRELAEAERLRAPTTNEWFPERKVYPSGKKEDGNQEDDSRKRGIEDVEGVEDHDKVEKLRKVEEETRTSPDQLAAPEVEKEVTETENQHNDGEVDTTSNVPKPADIEDEKTSDEKDNNTGSVETTSSTSTTIKSVSRSQRRIRSFGTEYLARTRCESIHDPRSDVMIRLSDVQGHGQTTDLYHLSRQLCSSIVCE